MATTRRARKPTTNVTASALTGDSEHMGPGRGVSSGPEGGGSSSTLPGEITAGVSGAVHAVQAGLPNRLPVYLGVAALLVVGVLEAPVALAGGLAYEALRRWEPQRA